MELVFNPDSISALITGRYLSAFFEKESLW